MIPFQPLKICPCCGHSWAEIYSLLEDDKVVFIGYQEGYDNLTKDFFLFLHKVDNCGSSIAIEVDDFLYYFASLEKENDGKSVSEFVLKKYCSKINLDSAETEERQKIVEVFTKVLHTTKGQKGSINNALRIA